MFIFCPHADHVEKQERFRTKLRRKINKQIILLRKRTEKKNHPRLLFLLSRKQLIHCFGQWRGGCEKASDSGLMPDARGATWETPKGTYQNPINTYMLYSYTQTEFEIFQPTEQLQSNRTNKYWMFVCSVRNFFFFNKMFSSSELKYVALGPSAFVLFLFVCNTLFMIILNYVDPILESWLVLFVPFAHECVWWRCLFIFYGCPYAWNHPSHMCMYVLPSEMANKALIRVREWSANAYY